MSSTHVIWRIQVKGLEVELHDSIHARQDAEAQKRTLEIMGAQDRQLSDHKVRGEGGELVSQLVS